MKKIFLLAFCALFFICNNASADTSAIKNFHGYTIKNQTLEEVAPVIQRIVDEVGIDTQTLKQAPNTYYYHEGDVAYYIRLYPNDRDTNVFVVSNEDYDVNKNERTEAFKYLKYNYTTLNDKDAIKEYKFDFYDLARSGAFHGFFIAPDAVKPLKIGMAKLNDKFAKGNKKNALIPYAQDTQPIDLTCVDTKHFKNENAGVYIIRKEYRLKEKENKYVHAYEYIVRNTESSPMKINKITSERLASLKDVMTETFVDLDRLDLMDTVGSFPVVMVCTCGTSLLLSVPQWLRYIRVTKEAQRYAKTLPENYTLPAKSKMRILVMKYKKDPKDLNFDVEREGVHYHFSY